MAENIRDFIHFLGIEQENQIKSSVNLGEYFFLIHNLDILYKEALKIKVDKKEHKIPAFLFLNVHRELYLSMTNFLRLHKGKSFCNLRSAIDSTFTAYYLLKNPDKENVYKANIKLGSEEEAEWDAIFRNIKATIKKNITDFPLAKELIEIHEFCSIFEHSDALDVLGRYVEDKEKMTLEANYFDYEETDDSYKKWLIKILFSYFMIFGLFWAEFFKERAPEEISRVINIKAKTYQTKLDELRKRFPVKTNNGT
ncbi:MAG: hypothetical protein PHX80_05645 [Candidatus Nanoarchaeia archaeon]|nr:hypothetical protein [Candidatus Nanoarchaeia archaeon]MDD5546766.1 hypothetical protein [Candidatus Omnitrophota bacterium]